MPRAIQWEEQIGRRVKLRDLFVFFTVVDSGSMAKAGAKLGVSTPSVSAVIAGLEHVLGVRLLDRSPQGVVMTAYGEALLARARAAFDELRQGIREIEFIGDPHAGELRIGSPESITAGLLLPILQKLSSAYPRIRYQVRQVQQPTVEYPELRDRKVDIVLARWGDDPVKDDSSQELDTDVLLNDPFFLVASRASPWARRRKIDLGDLADTPLIIPPGDAWGGALVTEAFKRRIEAAQRHCIHALHPATQRARQHRPLRNVAHGIGGTHVRKAIRAQSPADRIAAPSIACGDRHS